MGKNKLDQLMSVAYVRHRLEIWKREVDSDLNNLSRELDQIKHKLKRNQIPPNSL
jgi:hypothetical protein